MIKKTKKSAVSNYLKTQKFHTVSKIIFHQLFSKLARLTLLKF